MKRSEFRNKSFELYFFPETLKISFKLLQCIFFYFLDKDYVPKDFCSFQKFPYIKFKNTLS